MRSIALALAVLAAAMLAGCGSNTPNVISNTGVVTVTLSPTTASVQTGKTQQFTATVTGSSNLTVTWKVNDVVGGNSTLGTISTSGLYTAPATPPSPATVSITATSAADTSKSATASLTVQAPISVAPSSITVAATQTQQFNATVVFSTNTAVTWQVNGVTGGDTTHGTISDAGLYTAPSVVPSPRTVTITAISKADATQKATATVTITAPPIVISPTAITMLAGVTQQFSATAGGNTITPIWTATCQSQVAGACGSITKDGNYSSPASPPPGGTVTIGASVADGSAAPSNTTVTIQFANITLNGSYAFSLSSQVGSAFSPEIGSIACDGFGDVVFGQLDKNGSAPIAITGGSYTIGTDGRGTVTIKMGSATETWQLVVVNQTQAMIARLDGNKLSGSGTLDLQTIGSGLSALNGGFSLNLRGVNTGSSAGAAVTGFAMAGGLAFDGAGNLSSGLVDANVNGAVTNAASATGNYQAPSNFGRGVLNMTTSVGAQSFIYYQVDNDRFKVIESDTAHLAYGELVRRPAGPFSNASYNGRFAFTLGGRSSGALGGLFAMNGNGGINSRVIDGATQVAFDNQGGYTVTDSATGRAALTWTVGGTTQQFALYPRSDGGFAMIETDPSNAAGGIVQRQTLTTPSVISLIGSFAVDLSGTELGGGGQEIATGIINLTGSTTNIQGIIDLQNATTTTAAGALQAGAFTVDIATGRGVTTAVPGSQVLPGAQLILYLLDANHALVLESDGSRVLLGPLTKQF